MFKIFKISEVQADTKVDHLLLLVHRELECLNTSNVFRMIIKESLGLKLNTFFIKELRVLKHKFKTQELEKDRITKKSIESAWLQKFQELAIKYRNIGHDWQFTSSQQYSVEQYHFANEILKECLESECYIDRDTRQYITDTFCRPLHLIPPRS